MKYQYWLSNIPGVGCKTIHRLLGQAGSAEEIYFLKKEQLEKISGLSDRQEHAITDRKKNWNLEEKYAALGESILKRISDQCWFIGVSVSPRLVIISNRLGNTPTEGTFANDYNFWKPYRGDTWYFKY